MSPKGKESESRPPGEIALGASHPVWAGSLIMSRRKGCQRGWADSHHGPVDSYSRGYSLMLYLKMGVVGLDLGSSLFPLYNAFNFSDVLGVKPLGRTGFSCYVP